MTISIELNNKEEVLQLVKRMLLLIYNATDTPPSLSTLQAIRDGGEVPAETKLWNEAYKGNDQLNCDTLFGKKLNWSCAWTSKKVFIDDVPFDPKVQEFAAYYHSNMGIIHAAVDSLEIEVTIDYY